jgi:hypothetical protein
MTLRSIVQLRIVNALTNKPPLLSMVLDFKGRLLFLSISKSGEQLPCFPPDFCIRNNLFLLSDSQYELVELHMANVSLKFIGTRFR